jgi:hypothetical protein
MLDKESLQDLRHPIASSTNMSLPSKHHALVVIAKGKVAVQEKNIPTFSDDEILVRVKAVALNPTDWKVGWFTFFSSTHAYTMIAHRLSARGRGQHRL